MSETVLRPSALDPGSSVLLAGPPMTGKRTLLYDLLGGSPDRSAALVTTKATAERSRRAFLDAQPDTDDWQLSVVDCVTDRSVRDARHERTRYVSNPADLTGIGIAVSGFLQDCYHDPTRRRTRVGLHSLSTLLMYADLRRVYQFVHVISGRIESSGFAGVFALDTAPGDQEARNTLASLFDAMVETRDTGDGPELRVRGGDFGPRRWTPYTC